MNKPMTAQECETQKKELRRRMRAMRRALSAEDQERDAENLAKRILKSRAYANARTVMAYMAAGGEISLMPVIRDILDSGRVLVLPLCEGPGRMSARRVEALEALQTGAYGIAEPTRQMPTEEPSKIDLILVPGTAFDRSGGRIGQGGGYYDRFLRETKAVNIGVCHAFALLEHVPVQEHDRRVDGVMTPDETVDTDREP